MTSQALFFQSLEQQFHTIFSLRKDGKDNQQAKLRAQGFIHAGELLQLCQREQVQHLMEQVHQNVFGFSLAERDFSETSRRQQAIAEGDYDYFEQPAWGRYRK